MLMMALLVIALTGPFFIKKPDGTPLWEFGAPSLPKLEVPGMDGVDAPNVMPNDAKQSFYKWQDEQGRWYYSDKPRTDGDVEVVTVDTKANVIPGMSEEQLKSHRKTEVLKPQSAPNVPSMPLPMTVPLDKVSKMVDDAQGIQTLLEQRNEQMRNGR